MQATDFTRERVVTWPVVLILMLRGQKGALPTAVNKFLSAVGEGWRVVTASAYRQARQKVQPEVVVPLKTGAGEECYARYGADKEVVRWQGQRGVGGEGSYLKLPDTKETRGELSGQTNQHVGGEQGHAVASVRYALRNDVGLSAALGPQQAEKTLLFGTHLAGPPAGEVWVCDRAYAE